MPLSCDGIAIKGVRDEPGYDATGSTDSGSRVYHFFRLSCSPLRAPCPLSKSPRNLNPSAANHLAHCNPTSLLLNILLQDSAHIPSTTVFRFSPVSVPPLLTIAVTTSKMASAGGSMPAQPPQKQPGDSNENGDSINRTSGPPLSKNKKRKRNKNGKSAKADD